MTQDIKEEPTTENPKEEPVTEDPEEDRIQDHIKHWHHHVFYCGSNEKVVEIKNNIESMVGESRFRVNNALKGVHKFLLSRRQIFSRKVF